MDRHLTAIEIPSVIHRQPFDVAHPDGYLESDLDFIDANRQAAVWFLEHAPEILRLAEENAELRAEPEFVAKVARAVRDEGDRIRRELEAEIRLSFGGQKMAARGGIETERLEIAEHAILAALDRICPEEG